MSTITLQNADNALKTVYLDVITEQLNHNTNPFLAAIEHSTEDVWGKEVRKMVTYGVNGGFGAGTEDGKLPPATGNNYAQFVTTLKNLYGTIEISDKAVKASQNNAGAFVNLINSEMEGLIKASKYNFGRMLFGSNEGCVSKLVEALGNEVLVKDASGFMVGMVIELVEDGKVIEGSTRRIIDINDTENTLIVDGNALDYMNDAGKCLVCVQNSYNNELTGLESIFNLNIKTLYGVDKDSNPWLVPYIHHNIGDITEERIQFTIDEIERKSGSQINFIMCSWGVRRALQKLYSQNKIKLDTVELQGGYKTISINGIPVVVDRFCPKGRMYFLNTNDFKLHQLCDWQWLADDDGRVLKQIPGKPVYSATLVKYADLMCSRPCGQGMLAGITEA